MKKTTLQVELTYEDNDDLDAILDAARDTLNQKYVPSEELGELGSPYFGVFTQVGTPPQPDVVRISPQDDGTAVYMVLNGDGDYDQVNVEFALKLLAKAGTVVEVAMNHPTESCSHLESTGTMRVI